MKLKDMIKKLKEFDEDSEVWINYSYADSDEDECFDSFNNFKFIIAYSWDKKPVLKITEDLQC